MPAEQEFNTGHEGQPEEERQENYSVSGEGIRETQDNLKKSEKKTISPNFVFGFLTFLGLAVLLYGFINLTNSVYRNEPAEEPKQSAQADEIEMLNELQNRDTDKDGLTDYVEQYTYQTSPYLVDTDSDGYSDKEEIDNGFDPLCPKGEDCGGFSSEKAGQDVVGGTEPNDSSSPNLDAKDYETSDLEKQEVPQDFFDELKSLTPDEVRQLLINSGQMTEAQVNEIDDETLMQIFNEVLSQEEQ